VNDERSCVSIESVEIHFLASARVALLPGD